MRKTIFLILVLATILGSCKSDQSSTSTQNPKVEETKQELPGLDPTSYLNLLENCDFIDYIFHDLPFSMSQDEKNSIVSNLKFISSDPVKSLNPSCKSIARIMYSVKGEIVNEADLYFSQGCTYFVFVKNEKPYAANLMTNDGAVFYNNILKQLTTSQINE